MQENMYVRDPNTQMGKYQSSTLNMCIMDTLKVNLYLLQVGLPTFNSFNREKEHFNAEITIPTNG